MQLKNLIAIIFLLSFTHTLFPMMEGIGKIGDAAKEIANQGLIIKTDLPETANNIASGMNTTAQVLTAGLEKTTATLSQTVNNSMREVSDALTFTTKTVCATAQELPNKVAGVIDASLTPSLAKLNTTTNKLVDQGVQAKLSIETTTLKTFGIMTVGVTLAAASIVLIYKELAKVEPNQIAQPEESGWKHNLKKLFSNRYTLGLTGLVSGLLLIAKSNHIATLYANYGLT